jgi:TPR repeat protein
MSARGEIVAARLFYMQAAAEGSAAAATGAGKTYDPLWLAKVGAGGLQPDPKIAAIWYRKAIVLGDQDEAHTLFQRLMDHLGGVQQTSTIGQAKPARDALQKSQE